MSDFISPGQIDDVIDLVTRHGTAWILAFVFASMFIENIFPPYPGDAVIFAAGFISGSGKLSIPELLAVSVIGSVASILVVYLVGRRYGRALLERRRMKFLHPERLPRMEDWFRRYGSALLLASRFLAGTRSLIALTAGVGGVGITRMVLLSGISVLVWNSLVIFSAYYLHSNWEAVYGVFEAYNRVILIAVALFVLFLVIRRILRRHGAG